MIKVTRLNGSEYVINAHQIESIEATPDTVITLISGRKLVVQESVDKIIQDVIEYRRKLGTFSQEE
ncbi:MAG: flagellar FlbD family protein [bacterium]|nr:flagellar FlbD family protein [bacterium]